MPIFRSLAEFKRSIRDGKAGNTGRPDDGTFDLAWLTNHRNAWRLAENGLVPFTRAIQKGKYDRSLAPLIESIEPGTLPLEGACPADDAYQWLLRLHQTLEQAHAAREPRNVTVESFVRSVFGYAMPSAEALRRISEFAQGKVVEIGAGRGYWAALLQNLGVEVEAFDAVPDPAENPWTGVSEKLEGLFSSEKLRPLASRVWSQVKQGTPDALSGAHRDSALLLVWPPKDELALKSLCRFEGRRLIYVGEPRSLGCAEDEFFDRLWAGWDLVEAVDIPRFPWHYDRVFLYERRPQKGKSGGH